MDSETEKTVRQYHSYLLENLINCGIVVHPGQISALQMLTNSFIWSHQNSYAAEVANGKKD